MSAGIPQEWLDRPLSTLGELALFLGGSADSFTGHLLALFGKADPANYRRLSIAFPSEARAWEAWRRMQPAPTWQELHDYLARPLPHDSCSL